MNIHLNFVLNFYFVENLTPKCPMPFLRFLEFILNWTKKSIFFRKLYQIFKTIIKQIQTRHIKDPVEEENTTILLMDWKIIMFDYEGVKTMKVIWRCQIWNWGHKKIWG